MHIVIDKLGPLSVIPLEGVLFGNVSYAALVTSANMFMGEVAMVIEKLKVPRFNLPSLCLIRSFVVVEIH
jgi:hypothetical protein